MYFFRPPYLIVGRIVLSSPYLICEPYESDTDRMFKSGAVSDCEPYDADGIFSDTASDCEPYDTDGIF